MQPPRENLGAKPSIKSENDLETGLAELAWCKAQREAEDSDLDRKIQELREAARQKLVVKYGKQALPIAERERLLEEMILAYVETHPEAATADGKKSRKYRHGTVGSRETSATISWAEGENSKSVLSRMEKTWKLTEKIAAWLKRLKLTLRRSQPEVKAVHFLKLTPSIDQSKAKVAHKDGHLTLADLRCLGMEEKPAKTTYYVEPTEYHPDLPD